MLKKFNFLNFAMIIIICSNIACDKIDKLIKQPSRNKIIFISKRDGSNQIYTMKYDGSNQTRISKSTESIYMPRVSPNGKQIVYNQNSELYLCDIDGNNIKLISEVGEKCYFPAWSKDGQKIVYSSSKGNNKDENGNIVDNIWVMNLADSSKKQLTFNKFNDSFPSFSPDGSRLVFVSSRDPINFRLNENLYVCYRKQIYIMNADGSDQKRLTAPLPNIFYTHPMFSPDGNKIVFTMQSLIEGENEWSHIYIMNIDGSHPMRISKLNAYDEHPCWSSDGNEILYEATINKKDIVMLMNNDGTNIRLLTDASADNFTASFFPKIE